MPGRRATAGINRQPASVGPISGHSVIPLASQYQGMADTKQSRDEQARDEEERQREWALKQALDRADEAEPPREELGDAEGTQRVADEQPDSPRACHRRGCEEAATFVVLERYQEDTGQGAVEAAAALCRAHTAEESPTNLDGVYAGYVFRVTPIPGAFSTDPE